MAAPRPYELLWVDPDAIEYCTLPSLMAQCDLSRHGSHVVAGDWDRRPIHDGVWYTRAFDPPVRALFEDHALYRSMVAHFEADVPWSETDWYRWVREHPDRLGQYPDVETMERRLAGVEALYESVARHGYRTQRQLAAHGGAPLGRKSFPCPQHHEVDVNISRDGTLLFNYNGRHRLAVAKLLGIDQIPVRVFARHERWQRYRTHVVDTGVGEHATVAHPDVQQLRTEASHR